MPSQDLVELDSYLAATQWHGLMDTALGMPVFTGEGVSQDPVLHADTLQGSPGADGDPAPPFNLQYDTIDTVTSFDELAAMHLGVDDAGKAWWIDNMVFRWTGAGFEQRPIGVPGPRGELPDLTYQVHRLDPSEDTRVDVDDTDPGHPILNIGLALPRGPRGPAAPLRSAADYTETLPPAEGQTLTWDAARARWTPSDYAARHPRLYTVPEAAFAKASFYFSELHALSYRIDAQDYDWIPYVAGHIKAVAAVLSTEPFRVDASVRLGGPDGPQIAHGAGSLTEWAHIVPEFTSKGHPSTVVPRGQAATISLVLHQQNSVLGVILFDPATGPTLSILTVPAG